VFLRRRERAKSEFRRRNIFDLYIEEVVEACARLKGGRLPKERLKSQLQKIALKRTGGTRTDEILGKNSGPEGLPHSIIVTADGAEGEAPILPGEPTAAASPETGAPEPQAPASRKGKATPARPATRGAVARGKLAGASARKAAKAAKATPTKTKPSPKRRAR
jgi:DNA topoisomerase-6 subunit B